MPKIISQIRQELKSATDKTYNANMFFKEPVKFYPVRYPIMRKIAKKYWDTKVKNLPKKEIIKLCEELLQSKYQEEIAIAFMWARFMPHAKTDFKLFEKWIKKYCTNWGSVDDLCTGLLGKIYFKKYPELVPEIKKWRNSKNRWVQRSSIVALVPLVKEKKYLPIIFETATYFFNTKDDLLQKATGWMLRDTTKAFTKEGRNFVMKNKLKLPRTTLRYAIEHYPPKLKKKTMEKKT